MFLTAGTADAVTLRGEIALRLKARNHTGPETIRDRRNESDRVLALSRVGDTPRTFFNKSQGIRVEGSEAERRPQVPAGPGGVSIEPIRVQLVNRERCR